MDYMKPLSMKYVYDDDQTSTELTLKQEELIAAIRRPQLQEDVYTRSTAQETLQQRKPVFPLREID